MLGEFHALIVRHAKETCQREPRCGGCALADMCRTGSGAASEVTAG